MTDKDRDSQGRRGAIPSSSASVTAGAQNPVDAHEAPVSTSEGLASHFVRRTDNDFHGIDDPSLIGEDIGDDLVDENGDPIEE